MVKLIFKIFTIEPSNPDRCSKCDGPITQQWYIIANYEVMHDFTLDFAELFENQILKIPLGVYTSEKSAKRALHKNSQIRNRAPHEIDLGAKP